MLCIHGGEWILFQGKQPRILFSFLSPISVWVNSKKRICSTIPNSFYKEYQELISLWKEDPVQFKVQEI